MMYFSLLLSMLCLSSFSFGLPRLEECRQFTVKDWCKDQEIAKRCGIIEFCKISEGEEKQIIIKDGADVDSVQIKQKNNVEKVQIDLYYESLCPDCQRFIASQLFPTYQKLYSTGIFEISLFPYGNAEEKQVGDKWEFNCQHGEMECRMNLFETCALHMLSHPHQFMPFIHCIEKTPTFENVKQCAEDLQIELAPILACYNGNEGNYLEHQMAEKTNTLVPKHQYVPWVLVNGVHTEALEKEAETDLIGLICRHYKGVLPHACRVHLKDKNSF